MGHSCYDITVMVGIWHLSSAVKIGENPTNISTQNMNLHLTVYLSTEKTLLLKKYKP